MPWNLVCDPWVSWSFLQNNNHQAVNKMKMKMNIYIYIYIYTCVCVCGVCVCVCKLSLGYRGTFLHIVSY